MRNYVVITYYQLLYAILHVSTSKVPARIWIQKDYLSIDPNVVERLDGLNIFDSVHMVESGPVQNIFFEQLAAGDAKSAFTQTLERYFEKIFSDISEDTFYIFNEFQLCYYYVEKYCKHIVICEDGYNSYKSQNSILKFKGPAQLINQYVGTYFPKLHGGSSKVIQYLVNSYPEKVVPSHRNILEVCDFKEMENKVFHIMNHICHAIFDYPFLDGGEKSSIILTQPLHRAKYCSYAEQVNLYKKIVKEEQDRGHKVYIKPHPADLVGYESIFNKDVIVLQANFPVEVFNYEKVLFKRCVTFGSTSQHIGQYAHEYIALYTSKKLTFSRVARSIRSYVGESRTTKILYLMGVVDGENSTFIKNIFKRANKLKHEYSIQFVVYGPQVSIFQKYKHVTALNGVSKQEALRYCIDNFQFDFVFIGSNFYHINFDAVRDLKHIQQSQRVDICVPYTNYCLQYQNESKHILIYNILTLVNDECVYISRLVAEELQDSNSLLDSFLTNPDYGIAYLNGIRQIDLFDFFNISEKDTFFVVYSKILSHWENLKNSHSGTCREAVYSLLKIMKFFFPEEFKEISEDVYLGSLVSFEEGSDIVSRISLERDNRRSELYFRLYDFFHINWFLNISRRFRVEYFLRKLFKLI